jgi:hypothetical protein
MNDRRWQHTQLRITSKKHERTLCMTNNTTLAIDDKISCSTAIDSESKHSVCLSCGHHIFRKWHQSRIHFLRFHPMNVANRKSIESVAFGNMTSLRPDPNNYCKESSQWRLVGSDWFQSAQDETVDLTDRSEIDSFKVSRLRYTWSISSNRWNHRYQNMNGSKTRPGRAFTVIKVHRWTNYVSWTVH